MQPTETRRKTEPAFPLRDSIVLITGGGRGVGRLFALRLAGEGAMVVLVARSANELDEVANLIVDSGGRVKTFVVDVTDVIVVQETVARIENDVGPIDALINNAGVFGPIGATWECSWGDWWDTIRINLGGAVAFSQAVLPYMTGRRRGRIVNMASHAGAFRWPNVSAYSVSKSALIKFSENLALECSAASLTVFAYHPGLLPLGMTLQGETLRDSANPLEAKVAEWCRAQMESDALASEADAATKLVALLSGDYDALTGRYITVWDDLDALVENVRNGAAAERRDYLTLRPQMRGEVVEKARVTWRNSLWRRLKRLLWEPFKRRCL
jgi:NAD(P)-dependent dehydrogenase (short-subunit alcohol dehydrogenase family)